MAKGLPKSIIAKYGISKKAWQVYRGAKTRVSKAIRRPQRKAYKPRTRHRYVGRPMARRYSRRRRSRSFLNFGTFAKFIKIGALVAPAASGFMEYGLTKTGVTNVLWKYTGWNMEKQSWDPGALAQGWMPYIATSLIVTGVQKLNSIVRRL